MIRSSFKKYSFFIFILLSFGLFITLFLVNNRTSFFSKASSSDFPKNIKISNITNDSATISYQTDGKVLGNILFGTDPKQLDFISLDDRDQLSQTSNAYNYHHITLRGLEPNTTYFFSINSGSNNYLNSNELFNFKTGPVISKNPPSQIPATGNINMQNGTSPAEGLAYLMINDSQLVSALIKNGRYIIPLNSLRNSNLNGYLNIKPSDQISIEVFAGEQGNLLRLNSNELSPVKDILLLENYNFIDTYNPTINQPKINGTITPKPEEKTGWKFLNIFRF